jgi:hypothetical protein
MSSIWAEPDQATLRRKVIIPPDMSPMDFLLAKMRDPETEEFVRTRIAIALLPFTAPKLAVTANIPLDESFAVLLDRARKRSEKVMVIPAPIEQRPEPEKPATVEIKPHLPTVPDRRYRRY